MEISINNKPKEFAGQRLITVQQLLNLEIPERQQGIAIAVNNRVIARADWAQTPIGDKDQVTIIRATQGG
ncbi:MAG TPA: sulfur carrier protein ThiS [Bacteroidia bacterium]|jgi:sulfur carrier protein|nr:sulfur carrier protein ThiS [Bacteroidia bacterium]